MVRVEVAAAAFPVVGGLHEDGGDEAQAAFFVGKDGGHFGSAANLFVEVFEHVQSSTACCCEAPF